jgi:4-amino-4-deoxy-L-arabinose transferase-like glycosyltransferase
VNRLAVPCVLVLALAIRLVGIDFGLPNRAHGYPYNPDEWTPMQAFRGMDVRHLDFNPHYFDNPTLFYYLIGAVAFAADRVGFLRVDGDERYYFDHPVHLARIIGLGRGLAVVFGVASVWLLYRLARAIGLARGTSILAALLLAVHPSHVVHSHFMTVNTAVTFGTLACFLLTARWLRRGDLPSAALAGIAAGLALSTKYSAASLAPVLIAAAITRIRPLSGAAAATAVRAIREGMVALSAMALAFVAGSPYIVLAFSEFQAQLAPFLHGMFGGSHGAASWQRPLAASLAWFGSVHVAASTPLLLVASLFGAGVLARRRSPAAWLVLGWLALFVLLSLRAAHLATDSRFLPEFPILCLLAAAALGALTTRHRATGLALGTLVVLCVAGWTAVLLPRFVGPMPQERSSNWARENLARRERILLAGTAVYWNPDLPLREYLQARNPGSYERTTEWTFVAPDSFTLPKAEAKALRPDVVFLTEWLPSAPLAMEWLDDPDYAVVASFPGKVHLFGRRLHVPLDLYDVDIWVLRRRGS